ncbi:MAG: hypothetical protein AAGF85_04935 [Bacteroidota bacterium]
MKNLNDILKFGFLAFLVFIASCDEQEFGEVGEPRDKVAPASGTYSVQSLTLSEGVTSFVVSEFTDLSGFSLVLNSTGGSPSTYEINTDLVPLYISSSGNWDFDNRERPSQIIFNDGEGSVDLQAMPLGFDNLLKVEFTPSCNEVVYELVLEKQ